MGCRDLFSGLGCEGRKEGRKEGGREGNFGICVYLFWILLINLGFSTIFCVVLYLRVNIVRQGI